MRPIYRDRSDAGRALSQALSGAISSQCLPANLQDHAIVLALPRGGVPVAYEIARALELPLDLLLVRKLGVPGHEELAMGAIASGGSRVINRDVVDALAVPASTLTTVEQRELAELHRRQRLYRGDRPLPPLRHRTIILVDDGLATGSTMLAAIDAARQQQAHRIIVAVPVAPPSTIDHLRHSVDAVICPHTPEPFHGVGAWYRDFSQTTDDQVRQLLRQAWTHWHHAT
jgi:predicted phosphoribosyltransferase